MTPPASAISLDGRQFQFTATIATPLEPGDFVRLLDETGRSWIGQVESATFTMEAALSGTGRIFGGVDDTGRLDAGAGSAFASAELSRADAAMIDGIFAAATLDVGLLSATDRVSARLLARRFNRHTFWCGQSGSGKTYALGVVVEQLLVHTALPMVIFDPNSDFVRLREPHPHNPDAAGSPEGAAIADRNIRILRPRQGDPDGLRVRFIGLSLPSKAAVLRLDPLRDREEYNELVHLEERLGSVDADHIIATLRDRGTPAAAALGGRIENLRVVDWDVWARGGDAATDIVDARPDATVLDLGGFSYPEEHLVVALAMLDDLWAKRETRRPILIVIDEAHNLCSPDGTSPLQVAVRERIIQIAAEGRKFGLWLLLSTQRPSKVHPNIISQCDNLVLMKMSSPLDLDQLGEVFGFAPPALMARSPRFRQGEALFAGGFVPAPSIVQMRARLTREGGVDVEVPSRD